MNLLSISKVRIKLEGDFGVILEQVKEFQVDSLEGIDLRITFKRHEFLEKPDREVMEWNDEKWIQKPAGQNGYYFYLLDKEKLTVLAIADVDCEWKTATINYIEKHNNLDKHAIGFTVKMLMGLVFRYRLLFQKGILVHSSSIKWEGKGILFSAPSGTGKSTHAKLWKKYMGESVEIINDDTPVVRIEEGIPYVYGTPWSGSSDIHCNGSAPITAIVILEQAQKNSMVRLSAGDAVLKLMPRAFLPYFDKDMLDIALKVFEELISYVPVYFLKCRPDKEAVELVLKCVK